MDIKKIRIYYYGDGLNTNQSDVNTRKGVVKRAAVNLPKKVTNYGEDYGFDSIMVTSSKDHLILKGDDCVLMDVDINGASNEYIKSIIRYEWLDENGNVVDNTPEVEISVEDDNDNDNDDDNNTNINSGNNTPGCSGAELERFERTRLYKIESLKKEIEKLKAKLSEEKSRFFKRRSTIEEIEFDIEMAENELIKLQHQTGYDLYMESREEDAFTSQILGAEDGAGSLATKIISSAMTGQPLDVQDIASAVQVAKNALPGIGGLFKSLGKSGKGSK